MLILILIKIFSGFFNTYYFDCSESKKLCLEKFGVEKFPSMKLYKTNTTIVEEKINTPIDLPYKKLEAGNLTSFFNETNTFNYNYKNITSIDLPYQIADSKFQSKNIIGYFSDNKEEDELESFLLLSSIKELQANFDFVYVFEPTDDIRKLNKIYEINSVYFFYAPAVKKEYKNYFLNPSELFETYKSMADTFSYYKSFKFDTEPYASGDVEKIEDSFSLNKRCLSDHECAIFYYPATNKEEDIEQFSEIILRLNNMKAKTGLADLKISWVNSTCHGDMLDRIEADKTKTPLLVYFWPWRVAYTVHDTYFGEFPMTEFLQKGKTQRLTKTTKIQRDQISVSNRNCEDPDWQLTENALEHDELEHKEENVKPDGEKVEKTEEIDLENQKKPDL